ncbi:MAG: pimeloyl-ACP methyl ester carboxylesterase, partial [Myxococcota bacterium]
MNVQANGLSLNVQIDGEGDPLLLIMGIGAQLLHWPQGFVDQLVGKGFQCIRFDNRDMGLSQRMTGRVDVANVLTRRMLGLSITAPYTLKDMADDSVGVLDALNIDSAHILGASMGGMIAQRIAIDHPQRTKTLISLMSTPGRRRDSLTSIKAARALLKNPNITDAESHADATIEFLNAVGTPGVVRDVPELRRMCGEIYKRGLSPDGFLRQLAAIAADGDRTSALRKVEAPTLVLHGSRDPLISPAGGQ